VRSSPSNSQRRSAKRSSARTGVRRLDLSIRAPTAATVNQSSAASFDLKFTVVNAR
jgi:hypothetical protein